MTGSVVSVCASREEQKVVVFFTFSCCCSSLFSLANTVFVSLFRLIDAWIAFLSFPTDLKHKREAGQTRLFKKSIFQNPQPVNLGMEGCVAKTAAIMFDF